MPGDGLPFCLKISGPDGQLREVVLADGETTIGRDPSSGIVLSGRGVSRRHAKLVCREDQLTLVDLGSTYGTRVNDVPTLRRQLAVDDVITVGVHEARVLHIAGAGSQPRVVVGAGQAVRGEGDAPSFYAEERTLDPVRRSDTGARRDGSEASADLDQDVHKRQTVRLDAAAVQFVLDNPDEQGHAVEVLQRRDSDLTEAIARIESARYKLERGPSTAAPGADYDALLLMCRVSDLLAKAADFDGFVADIADLVMDEVRAETVVVLFRNENGQLEPQTIRHRGALDPGEVPVSGGVIDLVLHKQAPVISSDAASDDRIAAGHSLALYNVRSVAAAPLMLRGELRGVLYLNRSGPIPFNKPEADLVAAIASLLASGIERAELKQHVLAEQQRRRQLERFHPPEVVDQMFADHRGEVDGLREHEVTALVCDVKGFAALVGDVPPREMARVLQELYELLYEKVFGNGGSLVRLHDAWALALFGIHDSADRDAVWAVEAALALCREFAALATLWPRSNSFALRCALDTGPVVAGVVGSSDRLEHTALGVPIATTSELVRGSEVTCVLLTEQTWAALPPGRYRADLVAVRGQRVHRMKL